MRFGHRATDGATGVGFTILVGALSSLILSFGGMALAEYHGSEPSDPLADKSDYGVFALDGQFVHNVGELQINITNWGLIGSRPSINASYSDAPSAMWPAGSGVDYLWAAGLWVGAVKNGVPLVSTGQFTPEFLANADDPLDTVYEMAEGEPGGARYPDPSDDDDGDGQTDEDPKNLEDDDGDGLIDEDFKATGNQHFRCVMKDNTALAQELFTEHEPIDLRVVQQSFQWENASVDDFVGFEFDVQNIGPTVLKEVFLGFFADCDIGARSGSGIAEDDLTHFFAESVRAADGSLVPVSVACMYDADGDAGQSTGFFGIMFLNHPVDPTGATAPEQVGITSFQSFGGNQPFDKGGDPTNDAERYELLSRKEIDNTPPLFEEGKANDFRILLASGPFADLEPEQTLTFQAAMVIGDGLEGLKRNAAEAALTFYGAYFDRDNNPNTGEKGREQLACEDDFGEPPGLFGLFQDCVDSTDLQGSNPPANITDADLITFDGTELYTCGANARGIWRNGDCDFEARRREGNEVPCTDDGSGADPATLAGCTGIEGKETFVPWLVGLAPVAPALRLWETDGRVHVFWDNISQLIPDVRLQKVDFESYRVWRADGWDRPFGSSLENGPESRLWRLVAEYDVVNFFEDRRTVNGQPVVRQLPLGANTGLDVIEYIPAVLREDSEEKAQFAALDDLIERITTENTFLSASLDPDKFVRFRDDRGVVTEFGQRYPELADWECCTDAIDTLYWDKVGVDWFEYVDQSVHNGLIYFYSVTATDFNADPSGPELVPIGPGLVGDPQSNFTNATPKSRAQTAEERDQLGHNIYVVPNPATREALSRFSQLNPNSNDPTGVRVMFTNLPRARNTVKVFTLAGDLVQTIDHDGRTGDGSAFWNLVSRNGQEVVSGIYLFSVESSDAAFKRVVGRFVIVR